MLINQKKNHLDYIDGLRAIAAIYVVMHHGIVQYFDPSTTLIFHLTKFEHFFVAVFEDGHSAVDLFIVISGFSLMLSIIKHNYELNGGAMVFFKRRIVRIIPTYYSAMVFSMLLIWFFIGKKTGTHWDGCIPISAWDVATHTLLIHDYFLDTVGHINHAFWSIGVEFRIYLLFPLLVWFWRKTGYLVTLLVSVLIATAGALMLVFLHKFNSNVLVASSGISPYIILFVFGMAAADLSFSKRDNIVSFRRYICCFSPLIKFLLFTLYFIIVIIIKHLCKINAVFENKIDINYDINDIVFGNFSAVVIFLIAINNRSTGILFKLSRILFWRPLVIVGTFSYSLYLIHAPLLQVISQYILFPLKISRFMSGAMLVFSGTPVIIGVSFLFFLLFEKPFVKSRKV